VTTGERDALLQRTIDEIPAEIEAYDERVAIQNASLEARTRGKRRQITRLKRCSNRTHPGQARCRESVATNYEPHVRVFVRVAE
jgi:hypothetical protein